MKSHIRGNKDAFKRYYKNVSLWRTVEFIEVYVFGDDTVKRCFKLYFGEKLKKCFSDLTPNH